VTVGVVVVKVVFHDIPHAEDSESIVAVRVLREREASVARVLAARRAQM